MTAATRMAWCLGWAVPESWFASLVREAYPNREHVFIAASPRALGELEAAGPLDVLVGYSLGAQLLLRERARVPANARVALLAPIFAFASEENAGGRIARAQVSFLARWLRRDRKAALADFYLRAGLDVPVEAEVNVSSEDLAWGLEQLARERVAAALPAGWHAWCGERDALLDASRLHELVPEIHLVPEGTHHPRALLRAMTGVIA